MLWAMDLTSWTLLAIYKREVFQTHNLLLILSIIYCKCLGFGLPMKVGAPKYTKGIMLMEKARWDAIWDFLVSDMEPT